MDAPGWDKHKKLPGASLSVISFLSAVKSLPWFPMKLPIVFVIIPLSWYTLHAQSTEYSVVIRKAEFALLLYKGDEIQKRFSVCLGKNAGNKERRNDMRTPEGEFVVAQIQNASRWTHDFNDGKGAIAGAYGPWFIRLKATSGPDWRGIGIHGTHDTTSIGTRASEGCVRLKNKELEELKRLVTVGMPVRILP